MKNRYENIVCIWLLPTLSRGYYLQSLFKEFTKLFQKTTIYTGIWPGYISGYENSFKVIVMRKTKIFKIGKTQYGNPVVITLPDISMLFKLIKSEAKVVLTNTFTLWTLFAIILKPLKNWIIIDIYSGSAPLADLKNYRIRTYSRRIMSKFIDLYLTNSNGGKSYLMSVLKQNKDKILVYPYQIPDKELFKHYTKIKTKANTHKFLYVGRFERAKGIDTLLKVVNHLYKDGYYDWSLEIIGDGSERDNILIFINENSLSSHVKVYNWMKYNDLGDHFIGCDVFVFLSREDIWGMVVAEAMLFKKPIICSSGAGISELVKDEYNGFIVDPENICYIADVFKKFIENRQLSRLMGNNAYSTISQFTAEKAVLLLRDFINIKMNS